jgi:hypothetical protein
MRKVLAIIFCILAFSCETKVPTCGFTKWELLNTDGFRVFPIAQGADVAYEYKDKGKDSVEGGYYTFYKNGQLKEYIFLKNLSTSIYCEQYDSLGYLMYQKGSPLIHKSAEMISDSLLLKFYFVSLKDEYISLAILEDSKEHLLSLSKDTLFSNTLMASYAIKGLSKERDIDIYLKAYFKNKCTGEIRNLTDTTSLHYKPK